MVRIVLLNVLRDVYVYSLIIKWVYFLIILDIMIYDLLLKFSKWIVFDLLIIMLIKLEEFDDFKYMCVLWLFCKKLIFVY